MDLQGFFPGCPSNVLRGGVSEEFRKHYNLLSCVLFLLSGLLCWKLAATIGSPSKGVAWARPRGDPGCQLLRHWKPQSSGSRGKDESPTMLISLDVTPPPAWLWEDLVLTAELLLVRDPELSHTTQKM